LHRGARDRLARQHHAPFDDATDAEIDGVTWRYQATGLTGAAGVVVKTGSNQYELDLGFGAGLVTP
jgi:hypothetical protein